MSRLLLLAGVAAVAAVVLYEGPDRVAGVVKSNLPSPTQKKGALKKEPTPSSKPIAYKKPHKKKLKTSRPGGKEARRKDPFAGMSAEERKRFKSEVQGLAKLYKDRKAKKEKFDDSLKAASGKTGKLGKLNKKLPDSSSPNKPRQRDLERNSNRVARNQDNEIGFGRTRRSSNRTRSGSLTRGGTASSETFGDSESQDSVGKGGLPGPAAGPVLGQNQPLRSGPTLGVEGNQNPVSNPSPNKPKTGPLPIRFAIEPVEARNIFLFSWMSALTEDTSSFERGGAEDFEEWASSQSRSGVRDREPSANSRFFSSPEESQRVVFFVREVARRRGYEVQLGDDAFKEIKSSGEAIQLIGQNARELSENDRAPRGGEGLERAVQRQSFAEISKDFLEEPPDFDRKVSADLVEEEQS